MPEYKPFNQETDPAWNREPGITLVPGSNFLKEVSKFEQFDSKYTMGTAGPGNRYQYREFPKMLYRAERYNGAVCCMAPPPDPYADWRDHRQLENAQEGARRFTERCQKTVQDEAEYQRAMEDGWRESPEEAVEHVKARDRKIAYEAAHRNYTDRNLSPAAKAEAKAAVEANEGLHTPEIERQPVSRPTETITLCSAKTKAGRKCSNKALEGGRCGKHAA